MTNITIFAMYCEFWRNPGVSLKKSGGLRNPPDFFASGQSLEMLKIGL
jgi:hypothetical protein